METTPLLEFGTKRDNEERRDGGCGVVFDPVTKKFAVGKDERGHLRLFSGGVNPNESSEDGALREVIEESGLHDFSDIEKIGEVICHFHNSLKNVNRIANAVCLLIILESTDLIPTKLEEHEKFFLVWATKEEMIANWQARNEDKGYDHWIYFLEKATKRIKELGYEI